MSIATVASTTSQAQSLGSLLLQQLNAQGTSSQASSTQTTTTGDLLTVSPEAQQLAKVLSSLQSGGSTSTADSRSALLTALMNGQSNQSNPANLLKLLNGQSRPDSLFTLMGSASEGTSDSVFG